MRSGSQLPFVSPSAIVTFRARFFDSCFHAAGFFASLLGSVSFALSFLMPGLLLCVDAARLASACVLLAA